MNQTLANAGRMAARAADSAVSKILARWVAPALIAAVAALIGVIYWDLRDTGRATLAKVEAGAAERAGIRTDLAGLAERIEAVERVRAIRDADHDRQLAAQESRLTEQERLWRAGSR